jgi:hypothetical protein
LLVSRESLLVEALGAERGEERLRSGLEGAASAERRP